MTNLAEKRLFLFDIDGTLAVGDTLLPGARELLAHIAAIGGRSLYITNNSTKSRRDYVKKFARWALETQPEDFVTASYAACLHLREAYGDALLFALGTASFAEELRAFGLNVTTRAERGVRAVIVGYDSELTYDKVVDACRLLSDPSVAFEATNPDLCCPIDFGFVPDCGAICAMLPCAVQRTPHYIGKPDPGIVRLCMDQTCFSPGQTLVVGDRLYTDIACGINAGVDTCLVLTGEAQRGDLAGTPYQPTFVFENAAALLDAVRSAGKGSPA